MNRMNDLFNLIYLKHNIIYGMFPIIDSNKGHKLTEDEPNQTKPNQKKKSEQQKSAHWCKQNVVYSHTQMHRCSYPKFSRRFSMSHFYFVIIFYIVFRSIVIIPLVHARATVQRR